MGITNTVQALIEVIEDWTWSTEWYENQPWPHMPKNSQSGPHLKARQWSSRNWEGRQWIKPSNRICPDSLGLGFT